MGARSPACALSGDLLTKMISLNLPWRQTILPPRTVCEKRPLHLDSVVMATIIKLTCIWTDRDQSCYLKNDDQTRDATMAGQPPLLFVSHIADTEGSLHAH